VNPDENVNSATGDLTEAYTPFSVPALGGPLALTLTYDSEAAQATSSGGSYYYGPYGFGWQDDLSTNVQAGFGYAIVTEENGSQITFYVQVNGACPLAGQQVDSLPGSVNVWCAAYRVDAQFENFSGGGGYELSEQGGKKTYTYGYNGFVQYSGNPFNIAQTFWQTNTTPCANGYSDCTDIEDGGRQFQLDITSDGTHAQPIFLVTQVVDPMGLLYEIAYSDPDLSISMNAYTDLASITDEAAVDSPAWSFAYDTTNSNQTYVHDMRTLTDPDHNTTNVTYDSLGRVSQETAAVGGSTTFGYIYPCQMCNTVQYGSQYTTLTFPDGTEDQDSYINDVLKGTLIGYASSYQRSWTYNYNGVDQAPAMTVVDPAGYSSTTVTDPLGNVTSYQNADTAQSTAYNEYWPGTDLVCWSSPPGEAIPSNPGCLNAPSVYTYYIYDGYGDLVSQQDNLHNVTNYGYNTTNGELCWMAAPGVSIPGGTSCSAPPPGSTAYGYDAYGNRTSETDPNGNKTTWTYDLDGDLLTEVSPIGNSSPAPIGAPAGFTTTYTYYSPGQLESVQAPYFATLLGNSFSTTTYTYDAVGNLLTRTDPAGYVTTATYDADNRICWTAPGSYSNPSCSQPPGSGATVFDSPLPYVANTDNPQTVTDGDGHVTQYFYDNKAYAGDATRIIDGAGNLTSFVYDADGNQCLSLPGSNLYLNGNVPTCTWQGGATESSYDGLGNVTAVENADGVTTLYVYADARFPTKPTQLVTPISTTTITYDADGHEVRSGVGSGMSTINWTSMAYTAMGQLCDRVPNSTIPTTCPSEPAVSGESTFSYDAGGQPAFMFDDVNGTIRGTGYGFDANGNMTTITESHWGTRNPAQVFYAYSAGNELLCTAYPTNIVVTSRRAPDCTKPASATNTVVNYGVDPDGRMTQVTDWLGHQTSFNYALPSTYQATSALANVTYPSSTGASINYTYDPAQVLTNEAYTGLPGGPTSTTWTPNGDNLYATQGSETFGYNVKNQVTSGAGDNYQYNGDGAMTVDTPTGQGMQAINLTPDSFTDQLTQMVNPNSPATTTTYAYDAVGNRCNQTTSGTASCSAPPSSSTTYAWNSYGQLCWASTGAQSSTCGSPPSGSAAYAYDGSGLRSTSTVGSTTQMYVWDESGTTANPTLLMDGTNAYIYGPENFGGSTAPLEQIKISGNTATYLASDPTGVREVFNGTGAMQSVKSYNSFGQVTSSGAGTTTPFGFEGGYTDPTGLIYLLARYYDPASDQFISVDPALASTGQPYAYGADDPINLTDPTGLCWICAVFRSVVHHVSKYARSGVHFVSKVVHTAAHFVRRHWKAIVVAAVIVVAVVAVSVATGGLADAALAAGEGAAAAGDAAAAAGAASAVSEGATAVATDAAATASEGATAEGASAATTEGASAANGATESAAQDEAQAAEQCLVPNSFAPSTTVLMADGTRKPINQVRVGEKVQAADPSTGKNQAEVVTAVEINHDHDLQDITVGSRSGSITIHSTQHHLFWDLSTRRWTEESRLHVGDLLRAASRAQAAVRNLNAIAGTRNMWDLTVANDHDFYVSVGAGSQTAVLVHNCLNSGTTLVRGGLNTANRFAEGSGVTSDSQGLLQGVSVNSGSSIEEAAVGIKNGQIGVSTVGAVEDAGGTVEEAGTESNPGHCLIGGLSAETLSGLFTPTIPNPSC